MFRKIILLLLVSSIAIFGFAQKSKQIPGTKSINNRPYFEMLINGELFPDATQAYYCPDDSITFDFNELYHTQGLEYTYCWYDNFHREFICDTTPIKLAFPIILDPSLYTVSIFFVLDVDGTPVYDTLVATITIDYSRTIIDIEACQGREITITTNTQGVLTYPDIQPGIHFTDWDTLPSASGCDSLVRWRITVEEYVKEYYEIRSCGEIWWGEKNDPNRIHVLRPPDHYGDYVTEVERVFPARLPNIACDTLRILEITIIDAPELFMFFDQEIFCRNDDPLGVIEVFSNFTAFDWVWFNNRRATSFTNLGLDMGNLEIEEAGNYSVTAYMDTSWHRILNDLLITNCSLRLDTLVEDCLLIIPDIITPNGDGMNDVFGIKKLNPDRENELTIYDRWGKTVFSQKDYQCVFKGGAYLNIKEAFAGLSRNGQALPDGTYYYAFVYDAFPKKITYSGTVTIMRGTPK